MKVISYIHNDRRHPNKPPFSSLRGFFDGVKECEVTDLEIHNYIESVTDHFQQDKLELLGKDLSFYLFNLREERRAAAVQHELPLKIKEYKEKGKELPYQEFSVKLPNSVEHVRYLDIERLCFPFEFFCLYKLEAKINALLKEQVSSKEPHIPVPMFRLDKVTGVVECLRPFFSEQQRLLLEPLLQTGSTSAAPLVFLDNANKLADAFRRLYQGGIINGCKKTELEAWVQENFAYKGRKGVTPFTPKYLNDIISSSEKPCQSPILEVEEGEIYPMERTQKKYFKKNS